ncbi:MAG: GTPase Era [Anaerolineae bacterium]|nr:GTPase Era [Anaerolineae bacterium]MCI0611342.1 GTPase Era [Anaerolineae bacterium]
MTDFRSGFIAIIGRPNVGKSTLVNALLGQKIAAVSPKPQTTRKRQLGILTTDSAQLVFVDTPGIHSPRHKLGQFLNQEAEESLEGVDVILWLVDASVKPTDDDKEIASLLNHTPRRTPLVLAANKMDLVPAEALTARLEAYQASLKKARVDDRREGRNDAKVISISATQNQNLDQLQKLLISLSPIRPPEFDEEQVTDSYERDIAADLIREACLHYLRDEVPHGVGVRIDEFAERDNGMLYIAATIFVERNSQKGILIGEGGRMMKAIGSGARKEIEEMSGRKVFLELRVKVLKDWRNDENAMQRLGYRIKNKKRK